MAKLIKFPLNLADGTKARSLEELREHADIQSLAGYYRDGKLQRWLAANYLDEENSKIESIRDLYVKKSVESGFNELKELTQALGINSISEEQIANYNQETSKAPCVEDDEEIKEKLKPYVEGTDIDLDDWAVSVSESENEDYLSFFVQSTKMNISTTIDLWDGDKTYKKLALTLSNLTLLSRVKTNTLCPELFDAFVKPVGDTIHVVLEDGNEFDYIIAKKDVDGVLLIEKRAEMNSGLFKAYGNTCLFIDAENSKEVWQPTIFLERLEDGSLSCDASQSPISFGVCWFTQAPFKFEDGELSIWEEITEEPEFGHEIHSGVFPAIMVRMRDHKDK